MPQRRLEGRNGQVARAYLIRGWTQTKIAEEYGISQARVSEILAAVKDETPEIDKAQLIQETIELIRLVKDQAVELIELAGAPVAVGKDGQPLIDPDTGATVRDYSGRIAAARLALDADNVLAKRLGLDSASKVESTSVVKYEIVGLGSEDLA